MEKTFKNKVASAVSAILKFMLMCIMCLAIGILFILIFVLMFPLFNPISFWVWALVHPKSASKCLYYRQDDDFVAMVCKVYCIINKNLCFILPWRSRKEFLYQNRFEGASVKDEIRYFNEAENKEALLEQYAIGRNALNSIWIDYPGLRKVLLPYIGQLDLHKFMMIINSFDCIRIYAQRYTLSDDMLREMFKSLDIAEFHCFLQEYIHKNGLSQKIIVEQLENATPKKTEFIKNALKVYKEKEMVRGTKVNLKLWQKFCHTLEKDSLSPLAQKEMNETQYRVYHELGHSLCDEAISYFLAKERYDMAESIIKNELIGKKLSNVIASQIYANAKYAKIYLEQS